MARINYTARARKFATTISIYCGDCWAQTKSPTFKHSTLAVTEDKILFKPFFGVEFGPDKGSTLGSTPKDIAFQKAVYKAMIAHNRDAHPRHIQTMIRMGWMKKQEAK